MVGNFYDRRGDPSRSSKWHAFDRYGEIQVHNFYVERRVFGSEHGNGGSPHRFEFLTVQPQKIVPNFRKSNQSDILHYLHQFNFVVSYDFRHVIGALYRYRVPHQGKSLAVQDTDHQELCRGVVHCDPLLRVHGRLR